MAMKWKCYVTSPGLVEVVSTLERRGSLLIVLTNSDYRTIFSKRYFIVYLLDNTT